MSDFLFGRTGFSGARGDGRGADGAGSGEKEGHVLGEDPIPAE